MLKPLKRCRTPLTCAACGQAGTPIRLGRVTTSAKGQTVLHVASGNGTMVTDAATRHEWIIVCRHGHHTIFHGHTVVWKRDWDQEAA